MSNESTKRDVKVSGRWISTRIAAPCISFTKDAISQWHFIPKWKFVYITPPSDNWIRPQTFSYGQPSASRTSWIVGSRATMNRICIRARYWITVVRQWCCTIIRHVMMSISIPRNCQCRMSIPPNSNWVVHPRTWIEYRLVVPPHRLCWRCVGISEVPHAPIAPLDDLSDIVTTIISDIVNIATTIDVSDLQRSSSLYLAPQ